MLTSVVERWSELLPVNAAGPTDQSFKSFEDFMLSEREFSNQMKFLSFFTPRLCYVVNRR